MGSISDADKAILWRAGRIASWKLDANQLEVYHQYRKWEKETTAARDAGIELPGLYPRVFVLDFGRRVGKDHLSVVIRLEDAIRRPKSLQTYGTSLYKDISDIIIPLVNTICSDCPPHLKPIHRDSYRGQAQGLYLPNGSVIKLVGCERSVDSLRGRHSDSVTISESAFVSDLDEAIGTVLMPHMLGRNYATILLNSTPNPKPGMAWDTLFCPDAISRGAYVKKTLLECPRYSDSEKMEFIKAAGGITSERCLREYFCERIRSESTTVLPEFSEARHVVASPMPEYCSAFTIIDPGIRDQTAIMIAYHDFDRDKLVIRRSWSKAGQNTNVLVEALRKLENETWHGSTPIQYWDKDKFKDNPRFRYSDTDARLIQDLNSIHKITISAVDKVDADASLHSLRNALHQDKIEIHPDAVEAIAHFRDAVWNAGRTSYERSALIGHADLVDCGKYLVRAWQATKHLNPHPPKGIRMIKGGLNRADLMLYPHDLVTKRKNLDVLKNLFRSRR